MIDCPLPLKRIAENLPVPLYIVGGYVRNSLLWQEARTTDIDVCASLTVEELQGALAHTDVRIVEVNPRVGTVLLSTPTQHYEYTTFRHDSYPIGGWHTPQSVKFVSSPQEDALRRDFRINALYYDVLRGEVVDPLGGLQDLSQRLVHCTREPQVVFGEDGLRILRLARFCAELGFAPHEDTFATAQRYVGQLADISAERRREELNKILLADAKYGVPQAHETGLTLLDALGAWPYLVQADVHLAETLRHYPAHLPLRLAGLCRAVARQTGRDRVAWAQQILGQDGLRCSNHTVQQVVRLLEAEVVPNDLRTWRLWAAHYADITEDVGVLWNDAQRTQWARTVVEQVRQSKVPLRPQDLPVDAQQLQEWGVPRAKLGKVLQQLVEWSIGSLTVPTPQDCAEQVQRLQKEMEWN